MKKLIFLPVLFAGTVLVAQTKAKTPAAVNAAFAKAFPAAGHIRYEKEGANYEISFSMEGQNKSAIFTPAGQLMETETTIKATDLPAAVMPYFNAHYKGKKVDETARIVDNKGKVTYEVGIKDKDILFDANGKFLKEAKD